MIGFTNSFRYHLMIQYLFNSIFFSTFKDAEFPNGAAASQIKLSTKEKVQRHIQHNVIERQNVVDRQNVFDRQNVVDRQNVGEDLPPSYDAAVLSLSNLRVAL